MVKKGRKHGQSKTRLYVIWKSMIQRCTNPKHTYYHYYGGKGVKVCKRWQVFELFKKDMSPTYEGGLTLDRVDATKNYIKNNCRWATITEQNLNRSNNVILNTPWGRLTTKEAAEKSGIKYSTLVSRRQLGWSEEMMFSPVKKAI